MSRSIFDWLDTPDHEITALRADQLDVPDIVKLMMIGKARAGAQEAEFRQLWPFHVDMTPVIHTIEDISAPYVNLDDPIELRKPVKKWLAKRFGTCTNSWPFNAAEPWGRYGNLYGFHTQEDLDAWKRRFLR